MKVQKASQFRIGRKILFVLITCAVALILGWIISRVAFQEMMSTVENLTTPDSNLQLVGQISRDIMQLDQGQRAKLSLNGRVPVDYSLSEEGDIVQRLDILRALLQQDTAQTSRIDSIEVLLGQRNKLFTAYAETRESLFGARNFAQQMDGIGTVIQDTHADSLSAVLENMDMPSSEEEKLSFIQRTGRYLGLPSAQKKQREQAEKRAAVQQAYIDSVKTAQSDEAYARVDSVVQHVRANQERQRTLLINQEAELMLASQNMIAKMLHILQDVEYAVALQREAGYAQSRIVVNQSIIRIGLIFLAFFMAITILTYFIFNDIQKSNAYRNALEAAKTEAEYHAAAKQRFLASMSHELRTPLQSIIGYTEQLKQQDGGDRGQVDAIYHSSEHLLQIVNEILDYSRINSGKITLNQHRFDSLELIEMVVTVMQAAAQKKGIDLRSQVHIEDRFLVGDDFRIRQILLNLLSNAIKFTDQGTVVLKVRMEHHEERSFLNIVVSDTGQGISAQDISRIFEDFEQAENANSGTNYGSGLGLSIVKAICDAMGGSVSVESERDLGSVFTVNIPLTIDNGVAAVEADEPAPLPAPIFEGKVWVVDDDRLILQLCESILEKHEIPYRSFSSPEDILSADWDDDLQAILMDIRMPGMSGIELNKELRNRNGNSHFRIYAFTAQAMPEEQQHILDQGFDGILLKPFKEADFLRLLRTKEKTAIVVSQPHHQAMDGFALSQEEMKNIMVRYRADTSADIEAIKVHYAAQEGEQMELLLHRMAGRTAQMGEEKIAFRLRKMEIDVRNGQFPQPHEFQELIKQLEVLVS